MNSMEYGIMSLDIIPRRAKRVCIAKRKHVRSTWYNVARHYTAPSEASVHERSMIAKRLWYNVLHTGSKSLDDVESNDEEKEADRAAGHVDRGLFHNHIKQYYVLWRKGIDLRLVSS